MDTRAISPLSETGKYLTTRGLYAKITPVECGELTEDAMLILYDLQDLRKTLSHVYTLFEAWKWDGATRDEHAIRTYALMQEGEFLFPMMEKALTTASLKVEILAGFLERGGKSS